MNVNTQDSLMSQPPPLPGGHTGKRKSRSGSPFSKHILSARDKRPRTGSEDTRIILDYGDEHEEGEISDSTSQRDAADAEVDEGKCLYIGDLAYTATEQDLKDFFKNYHVKNAALPTNPQTKRPCGYAFVDIIPSSKAEQAVRELNGTIMLDRRVNVSLAIDGLSAPLADKHRIEGETEDARAPFNAGTDRPGSSTPPKPTDMLVEMLLKTDPNMPLYTRSLQNIVEICHSPPPGEVALGNIVEFCRAKGADQMKVSEILTDMQPLWSKKLASYLASLITEPTVLKEIFAVIFEEVESQNDLNVPHHMRDAIQAMLGGLTALPVSVRQSQPPVAGIQASRIKQGPTVLQRPPHVIPNRQFLSGIVDAHLRGDKTEPLSKSWPHGGASTKHHKDLFITTYSKQHTSQTKSSLLNATPRPDALMNTRTALPLENSFAMLPSLASAAPTGPKLTTSPSKLAMISIDAFIPSYRHQDIIRHCRDSLGPTAGLEKAVRSSDHTWILHFSSAMAAVSAIGRIVRIRREMVAVRPVPDHVVNPTVYDSIPHEDSAPRVFMAVFPDGPPNVDEVEVLRGIAACFPKLRFSLQGQRHPVVNNAGSATKHVKWIMAFDKAPGVARFRTPIHVELFGGAKKPLSVLWQPVSNASHCVICRQGHTSVRCPILHHFQCPDDIKIEQYVPAVH